jgi:anti-sigma regulatory factor (Ser/Thr protein kinase)
MTVLRQTVELPRSVDEVPVVRSRFGRLLREFGCADAEDVCALLVTELVTNAIRHGEGAITLETECHDRERVRVEVHDEGHGRPRMQHPDPWDDSGGRGLMLVDALSHAWGVDRDASGVSVWFDVVLPFRR